MSEEKTNVQKKENENEGLPPILNTWKRFYIFVIVFLIVQIIAYKIFSIFFSI
jgi:hypothetical protein